MALHKSNDPYKIIGNWEIQSKLLKEKYPELNSNDLKLETGKENKLYRRMEKRLGRNHEDIIKIIRENQIDANHHIFQDFVKRADSYKSIL